MPRLVRKRSFLERLKAYLDPLDLFFWLSEQVQSDEWQQWQSEWTTPIGICINLVFLIARANSDCGRLSDVDDVFNDESSSSPRWTCCFSSVLVYLLSAFALINAAYTFIRRRHYRLFEAAIDSVPSTPSAQRVKVNSSPASSSPMRYLSRIFSAETAESRAHPDHTSDVWELAVWDPAPLSISIFCLFSPGHLLIYLMVLPSRETGNRSSVAIVFAILSAATLSLQLLLLCHNFTQQSKDRSIVNQQLLNEYDTKYVHPNTQLLVRDVGTQFSPAKSESFGRSHYPRPSEQVESIDTYPAAYLINRGFHTRPNPNYLKHVDPDGVSSNTTPHKKATRSQMSPVETPAHLRDLSSPLKSPTSSRPLLGRPIRGLGGSLGVHTHANSPLRKSSSMQTMENLSPRRSTQNLHRSAANALKRTSLPAGPKL